HEEYLRTQFAAVEILLRRTDRQIAQHDILIATCFEVLWERPLTTAQLCNEVRAAWPGLRITSVQIEAYMQMMSEVGNVQRVEGPGSARWQLMPSGAEEVVESGRHSEEIIRRFKNELADEIRRLSDASRQPEVD